MPYYLGIDGGGSKTTCAVGDATSILATATAGPSNIVRVGEARSYESLRQAVQQACAAAGITLEQIARTCMGASGGGRKETSRVIHKILLEIMRAENPAKVQVVGDMETALEAAFGSKPGVIVIAGTGSIAYGRDEKGRIGRAGGWGFAISDEGSAHWIGRAAIAAVLRASDQDDGTMQSDAYKKFLAELCGAWAVNSAIDLARAANASPPPDFAALFPAVAGSDDALAREVLSRAGMELAHVAAIVIRRLFGDGVETVPVATVGGVFRHSPVTRADFYNELRRLDPRVEINPQIVEPVLGALQMARRAVV